MKKNIIPSTPRVEARGRGPLFTGPFPPVPASVKLPDSHELYHLFAQVLQGWGSVPLYQVDSFNVKCSDLSLERLVLCEGTESFTCWIRTSERFQTTLSLEARVLGFQPAYSLFDRFVSRFSEQLGHKLFGEQDGASSTIEVIPVDPSCVPSIPAQSLCMLLAGTSFVEIHFWQNLNPKQN